MKKFIAIAIAVLTVFSFTTVAFAESTTTLTTSVPDAEYTLNIPADQEIAYGVESTEIGTITIAESKGFAEGKNLKLTGLDGRGSFTSEDVSTTIPYELVWRDANDDNSGELDTSGSETFLFKGTADGSLEEKLTYINDSGSIVTTVDQIIVVIREENWGKALAGDYTATITFTAEVVAE